MRGIVPLARALSKLGIMSRTEAVARILEGDVRIGGRTGRWAVGGRVGQTATAFAALWPYRRPPTDN